jgi:hypothetical protein
MRKLLIATVAGCLLSSVWALRAHAQTGVTGLNTNFSTGFAPKNLTFKPIDTSKTMQNYTYNNPNFLANTARKTNAFSLSNMLPKVNLPRVGAGQTSTSPVLNNSPLLQKSGGLPTTPTPTK